MDCSSSNEIITVWYECKFGAFAPYLVFLQCDATSVAVSVIVCQCTVIQFLVKEK
jgi:hypothetical protein